MQIKLTPHTANPFVRVEGRFFRSVSTQRIEQVLDGSSAPGRYSAQHQKMLYLSATEQGVAAAMLAHTKENSPERSIVKLNVVAENIFDLRDKEACKSVGVYQGDAFGSWQDVVGRGDRPRSWLVADRLRELGAFGLIDPSRKAEGLWHLVLFNWNQPGWPVVSIAR